MNKVRFLAYWVDGTKPLYSKGIEIPYKDCQMALERVDRQFRGYRKLRTKNSYDDGHSFSIQYNDLDAIAKHGLEGPLILVNVEEFEDHTIENLVRDVLPYDEKETTALKN